MLRSKWVIRKYIKEVEDLYSMAPDELKRRNSERFVNMFRRAFDKSPFYRQLYMEAGLRKDDIRGIKDIGKLPIVTKTMVKEHAAEMLTVPKWKTVENHTSGTTGTPMTVYEDWPAIWREQAYFVCYRRRCGYNYGEPMVSLRGNLGKTDVYLKVDVSNTLYLSSYNINEEKIKTYYELIKQHKPVAIEGYPSSLYSLALLMRDHGMRLHIPVAFTSSETLLDYQRDLIEKQLDTRIYDHYGTTERSIRLSEALNHNGYFEDPGYSINEYEEDGVVTTSLINESFPLIRYKVDDVMETMDLTDENIQVRIKQIKGRKSSYLVGKDGTQYSSALLTRVFKDITSIDYAQFVQHETGKVTLNIVAGSGFTDGDMSKLKRVVGKQLGENNFEITINRIKPSEIIYTSRGKFNYVLNLMKVKSGGVVRRIGGRNEDYVVCKDGTKVMRLGFIMKEATRVKASQLVQQERGKLTIRVVPESGFGESDERRIVASLAERIGRGNMDVTIEKTTLDGLIYSKRGKFKYIIRI